MLCTWATSAQPGVLNQIGTAALAAYSLRVLKTGYNGPAINIRRSSDNATMDIGFAGPQLDVATASTFIGAGSGFVTKWYDQSGNGNDAAQATAANQPQLVLSRSTLNSRPAILFGAEGSASIAAAGFPSIFGAGGLYSAVFDFQGTPTQSDRLFDHGAVLFPTLGSNGKLAIQQNASTTNGLWVDNAAISSGGHQFDIKYSATSLSNVPAFNVDGSDRTTTNTQPTGTITAESGTLTIGNTSGIRGFPGYMAENLFFSTQPSAAQITALRANQKAYWGTP